MRRYFSGRARPIPPKVLLIVFIVLAIVLIGWIVIAKLRKTPEIKTYQDCVKAGNPILESYPEQCIHNGQSFINPTQNVQNPF